MRHTPEQLRFMAQQALNAEVDPQRFMLYVNLVSRLMARCNLSQRNVVALIRRLAA